MACRVYLGDYGPASPFELWRRGMSEWIEQANRMGRTDAVQSIMSESWDVLSGLTPDLFVRYGRRAGCDHSRRADPRIDDVSRRLAEEIRHFFYRTTRLLPFVFIVDNLHSADSDSLALMPEIAPEIGGQPTMFIGSFRPERIEPGTTAAEVIGNLQSCSGMHTIELRPLSEADVREYLADHGLSAGLESVTAMYSITGGHPLLLEELRALLLESGPADSSHKLDRFSLADNTMEKLHTIMKRRLSAITGTSRRILEVAAVLGEDLDTEALMHCAECTRQEATGAMKAARGLGILQEDAGGRTGHHFRHWLVQKSIAATIEPDTKRDLHIRVAGYLNRTLGGGDVAQLRRVAEHFFIGGGDRCVRRGIVCALKAGRQALRVGAWREAGSIVSDLEQEYRVSMTVSEQVELDLTLGIVMIYHGRKPEAYTRVHRAINRVIAGTWLGNALELILRPEIEDLWDRDFGDLLRGVLPGVTESHWINRSALVDMSNLHTRPARSQVRNGNHATAGSLDDHTELVKRYEQLAEQKGLDEVARHSSELRVQFGPARNRTGTELHTEVRARHAIDKAYRVLFEEAFNPITQRAHAAQALELARETGNAFLIAEAYHGLFRIAYRALQLDEARRITSCGLDAYPVHDPLLNGRTQVEALSGDYRKATEFLARLKENAGTGEGGPSVSHIALGGAFHSVAVLFGGVRSLLLESQEVLSCLLSRNRLSDMVRNQATVLWTAGQCYLDRLEDPERAYSRLKEIEPGPLLPQGSIERSLMLIAAATGWEHRVTMHLDLARQWCRKLGDRGTEVLIMVEAATLLSGGKRIGASRLSPDGQAYRSACSLFSQARSTSSYFGLASVPGLIRPPDQRLFRDDEAHWPTQSLPRAFSPVYRNDEPKH